MSSRSRSRSPQRDSNGSNDDANGGEEVKLCIGNLDYCKQTTQEFM